MATNEEVVAAQSSLNEADALARKLGHTLSWRLGRDSNRRGYSYHFCGFCWDCKAEVIADAAGSICVGDRDAREVRCECSQGTAYIHFINTKGHHHEDQRDGNTSH